MFDFTENKGFAEGMGPRDLMRLKTEAVEASINNRLALFMRRLVCEAGLDEDEIMACDGLPDLLSVDVGALLSDGRISAGTLSLQNLSADVDLLIRLGPVVEGILVCVDRDGVH